MREDYLFTVLEYISYFVVVCQILNINFSSKIHPPPGLARTHDIVLLAEGDDGGVIRLADGDRLDTLLDVDPRVAGGAVEVVARLRLPQPPAQRVLTSAAAHDEHVDLSNPAEEAATTGPAPPRAAA